MHSGPFPQLEWTGMRFRGSRHWIDGPAAAAILLYDHERSFIRVTTVWGILTFDSVWPSTGAGRRKTRRLHNVFQ